MIEQINVLSVDDDPADSEILRRLLEQIPCCELHFVHVAGLEEAKEALSELAVDVIFLDYVLSPTTGLEILSVLRSSGERRPIIVLTGYGDELIATQLIQAGADDYLVKGTVNPDVLRRAIDNATAQCNRRKLEEEHERLLVELQAKNKTLEKNNRRLAELYETAHELIDNVSHEFRTPLTVVKEFTSIIYDGLAGPTTGEQNRYLGTVLNRVDDLAIMIDDMLDINRLETGMLDVSRTEVEISDILDRARRVIERKAAAGNLTLDMDIDEVLPILYCDAGEIGRVLINLVTNATKGSREGGRISVWARSEPEQSQVRFGVTDDGVGLDPDALAAIQKSFRHVGGGVGADTKEIGLGLSIVKELVLLNFGDVGVRSESSEGSTFFFTVPAAEPLRLIDRYLEKSESFRNDSSFISLIEVRMSEPVDDNRISDLGHFLRHQIRRSDLLFRTQPGDWLLVAASSQGDMGRLIRRIEQSRFEANESRSGNPVPDTTLKIRGTWTIRGETDGFMKAFREALQPVELAPV
ncbi:MAG: hybrid sensor histidine kinase/response regulator [Phycisphaerales bacterium]|nr:MAG: hybrid sensor histidine kinase/response regulator [Phycisphaerales bacterium]